MILGRERQDRARSADDAFHGDDGAMSGPPEPGNDEAAFVRPLSPTEECRGELLTGGLRRALGSHSYYRTHLLFLHGEDFKRL